jgi:hypothetical protein
LTKCFFAKRHAQKIACVRVENTLFSGEVALGTWAIDSQLIVTNALGKEIFWWQYLPGHCAIAHSVAGSLPSVNIKH